MAITIKQKNEGKIWLIETFEVWTAKDKPSLEELQDFLTFNEMEYKQSYSDQGYIIKIDNHIKELTDYDEVLNYVTLLLGMKKKYVNAAFKPKDI